MSITQRFAGMLRRFASTAQNDIKAEAIRQAARHMEELQANRDQLARPYQPIRTAPKDGTVVLGLLPDSDIPHPMRWTGDWWQSSWDGHDFFHDSPRYWMAIPDDPDGQETRGGD